MSCAVTKFNWKGWWLLDISEILPIHGQKPDLFIDSYVKISEVWIV